MWLFTQYGFFSATRSRQARDKIQVRARAEKDIRALKKACQDAGLFSTRKGPKVLHTPGADYHWRIIVTPGEWAIMLAKMGEEIDYDNFKDHIHTLPDQSDKLDILHRLWSQMWEYQRKMEGKD